MVEEKEQSSEEKDLAQEALDATAASAEEEPSPAEEPEVGVPVAKHAALRKRAQAAEIALARSEGELDAVRKQQASQGPAAKSPLDLEIERQTAMGIPEDDMSVSPRIIRANDLYNQQVANQAAEAQKKHELGDIQVRSARLAKASHDDWMEVVAVGDGLLTKGELLDIMSAGVDFGEIYYAKLQEAIAKNAPKSETNAAPEKKPSKSEAEKKEEEKVPTQQEILNDIQADPQTIAAAQL